jgi:hypothetical protein
MKGMLKAVQRTPHALTSRVGMAKSASSFLLSILARSPLAWLAFDRALSLTVRLRGVVYDQRVTIRSLYVLPCTVWKWEEKEEESETTNHRPFGLTPAVLSLPISLFSCTQPRCR